ncbi:MAG: hypothetical protein L0387_34890 [Acidobacteria bacterium]|nr:hypothetical protein [Acidobacteriota bacterium]
MTIAAGFRCSNGVVLCADTQMTVPGTLKYPESKLRVWKGKRAAAYFVFSGGRDFSRMGIGTLVRAFIQAEQKGVDPLFLVEEECRRIYETYFPLPASPYETPFELSLLMSYKPSGKPASLWKITGPVLSPVEEYECIGAGAYLARSIASSFCTPHRGAKKGAVLAAYVLSQTKKHVDGCGGNSQIIIITDKADSYEYLGGPEIELMERAYAGFMSASRNFLIDFADISIDKDQLENRLAAHVLSLKHARQELIIHKEYLEKQKDAAFVAHAELSELEAPYKDLDSYLSGELDLPDDEDSEPSIS